MSNLQSHPAMVCKGAAQMKRSPYLAVVLWLASLSAGAQSLEDLNIQIHGFATQGFLYSPNQDIMTAQSSSGSAAWTEAVMNVSAQPNPKLRIGVQAHYFFLGTFSNAISIDWAQADYKLDDRFGIRVGKVKTPWGLLNDVQDLDPAYIWVLLPQSVYNITDRESFLSHFGAVAYGKFKLGSKLGKIEYEGWGGQNDYTAGDGIFLAQTTAGYSVPFGIQGPMYGAALHWRTPLTGLMVGASDVTTEQWSGQVNDNNDSVLGTETLAKNSSPNYFAQYEKDKVMVAYEYCRNWSKTTIDLPGEPAISQSLSGRADPREWYGMASYKFTPKLTVGAYFSSDIDRQAPLGPPRDSLDWAVSGRYDLNEFFYLKAEQHFVAGTQDYYESVANLATLKPHTQITALKVGVSF
jgi:hypothetical protein